VVAVHFTEDGTASQQDFLTGFELDEDVIGRPVDMEQGLDGSIYISDDYSGTIYRVTWGNMQASTGLGAASQAKDALADLAGETLESLVAQGAKLYADNDCAACHDPAAAAEGVQVKLLDKLKGRFDIEGLSALLDTPPGPMPRPDINDEERRALSVYLLSK
ncbi:MAG: c-type cytochrome, partial [Kordiimonas sp.]